MSRPDWSITLPILNALTYPISHFIEANPLSYRISLSLWLTGISLKYKSTTMIRSKQQENIREMMRGPFSADHASMQLKFINHSLYAILLILFTIILNYIFTHHWWGNCRFLICVNTGAFFYVWWCQLFHELAFFYDGLQSLVYYQVV